MGAGSGLEDRSSILPQFPMHAEKSMEEAGEPDSLSVGLGQQVNSVWCVSGQEEIRYGARKGFSIS